MCKYREVFSLAVLIDRGLVQVLYLVLHLANHSLFSFQGAKYAPLAQLVEHLTLNQGVQGSSP